MRQYVEVNTKEDAEEQLRTAYLELQQANEDMRKLLMVVNEEYSRLTVNNPSILANANNLLDMLPKYDDKGNLVPNPKSVGAISYIGKQIDSRFGKQLKQSKENIRLAGVFVDKAQHRLLELT